MLAPIALFVYNRPWHTKQALNALQKNELANQSVLFIYADGPKENASEEQIKNLKEVREIIKSQQWSKEVHIIESEKNKGLADSIIDGVTEVVNEFKKIIVLEDDIVTSKGFLRYMNDALTLYEYDKNVMQVSGFIFPIDSSKLPDTFFYNANTCWGWGTWDGAWQNYNDNALEIYSKLIEKKIDWNKFNAFQGNAFKEQLFDNIERQLNTWAIKWHASIYLNEGSVLHPKISLTRNIGFDGSGIHCNKETRFSEMKIADYIKVEKHARLENDSFTITALQNYFNEVNVETSNKKTKNSFLKRALLFIASKV